MFLCNPNSMHFMPDRFLNEQQISLVCSFLWQTKTSSALLWALSKQRPRALMPIQSRCHKGSPAGPSHSLLTSHPHWKPSPNPGFLTQADEAAQWFLTHFKIASWQYFRLNSPLCQAMTLIRWSMTKLHQVWKKLPEPQNQGARGYLLHGEAGEVPLHPERWEGAMWGQPPNLAAEMKQDAGQVLRAPLASASMHFLG